MMYYGNSSYKIAHYPFNVLFVSLSMFPSPKEYDGIIKTWLNKMPAGSVANWMVIFLFYFHTPMTYFVQTINSFCRLKTMTISELGHVSMMNLLILR